MTVAVAGVALFALETAVRFAGGEHPTTLYAGSDSHGATLLLAGAWLACTLRLPVRRTSAVGWATSALLGVLVVETTWVSNVYYFTGFTVLGVLCLGCVVGALGQGWFGAVLAWRPLRWLGQISYGVYLWHLPVFACVAATSLTSMPGAAVSVGATIGLAQISYQTIERFALRFKTRKSPRPEAGAVIDLTAQVATSARP